MIIEGHGRLIALKELEFKEIEIIKLSHLSDEQKKAYILAHNKLTMNTGFNFDILNIELGSIENIDMSYFGFTLNFDDEKEQKVPDSKELCTDDFEDENFEFTCPRCKFRWNDE